jgi:hypothetical protein
MPPDGSAASRVAKDHHQAAQAVDPPTCIAGSTTVSIDRKHALRHCPFSGHENVVLGLLVWLVWV